ncbi:MAG: hypothetical protein AAGG09_05720 [Pseudomonadota bacterium]
MTLGALGRAAALSVAVAGCAAPSNDTRAPARGPTIVPAPAGLDVAPLGQEIGFGRFQPGAVAAVTRVVGRSPATTGPRLDCPGGPLTEVVWPREDLTLYFADQAFVGWRTSGSSAGRICGASV